MDLNARITKTKQYIKDHAPAVVTAAASVTLVAISLSVRRELHHMNAVVDSEVKLNEHLTRVVRGLCEDDIPHTYYPGLGVHILPPEEGPKK